MLDRDLKQRVLDELAWEPSLDESDVGVVARDGGVSLTGFVRSYAERCAAAAVTSRVIGIKMITNEIRVHPVHTSPISDNIIACQAADILAWDVRIGGQNLTVSVTGGWLTLQGEVDWHFQKCIAKHDICRVIGVVGVSNQIVVKPKTAMLNGGDTLKAAFARNRQFDAENIVATTDGSAITLTGLVRTYLSRAFAAQTAWSWPGVTQVHEMLTIG
jgi:osmotically-inducible protein OsmY